MSAPAEGVSLPLCPDCHSAEVRPSRSSYPLDRQKLAEGGGGFWRCSNCGTRFLGPAAPSMRERKHRPHRHRGDGPKNASSGGALTRFVVPLLLLTATLLGAMLVLLLRDPEALVK